MVYILKSVFFSIVVYCFISISYAAESNGADKNKDYDFPSIMRHEDMVGRKINGTEQGGLLTSLIVARWKGAMDKYGRTCKLVSPHTTYGKLKETLNFYDEDATPFDTEKPSDKELLEYNWRSCNILFDRSPGLVGTLLGSEDKSEILKPIIPHAIIKTDHLICYMIFDSGKFAVSDDSTLTAILIDRESQLHSNEHSAYNKKRGILKTLLDAVMVSPH